jgi:integrase
MLQRAVLWGRIQSNPVAAVKKPQQKRSRSIRPIPPAKVEEIRRSFLVRKRIRDATLVSVLAYAGLRPGEALALTWGDIGERTILVERAVAIGEVKETKTGKTRSVRLLAPLAADLREWAMKSGRPDAKALVFPASNGALWTEWDWRNWRRRVFGPVAAAAGLDAFRPYDLRHSFVSLLFAEGRTVIDVARQAGHSPAMALSTYGHLIEEFDGGEIRRADDLIREARAPAPSMPRRARSGELGPRSPSPRTAKGGS